MEGGGGGGEGKGEGSAELRLYPFMLHECFAAALVLP